MALTKEETEKLRSLMTDSATSEVLLKLISGEIEKYRDACECSHEDTRFVQGMVRGMRILSEMLKNYGLPMNEYQASTEAFEKFRSSSTRYAGGGLY